MLLAPRTVVIAIAAIAVGVACWLAWREAWVCDDALISFRYVRNVVGGDGLVFNAGERVEGFSNFVFVVVLVPFELAGASLFDVSIAIGILATAIEVGMLVWLLHRREVPPVAIAIAAAAFATDRITAVWATGGLETASHGALVMALLALQLEAPRRIALLAALHAVVAASRPEGVIFFVVWIAHLVATRRTSDLRRALNVFVPAIALLVAARLLYYGELVANPYRAKVDGVPTLELGVGYTLWFLRRIGLYGIAALAVVPLVAAAARAIRTPSPLRAPLAIAGAFVGVQLVAVVATGGDYMTDFRMFRPVLGPLYVAIGCLVAIAWRRPPWIVAVLAGAVFVAGHAYRQLEPTAIYGDAPPPSLHKRILSIPEERPAAFAAALARFASPGDSIVADWGGYMAYGHELRTIDATGLVSKQLSRDFYLRAEYAEDGARERLPGHARWPTIEMMQRERVTFIFPKVNTRPPEDPEVTPAMPRRTREYPFLHVTVPLGDGRYLRFLTTLDADQIAARAKAKRVRACFRPAFGALTCVDPAR